MIIVVAENYSGTRFTAVGVKGIRRDPSARTEGSKGRKVLTEFDEGPDASLALGESTVDLLPDAGS